MSALPTVLRISLQVGLAAVGGIAVTIAKARVARDQDAGPARTSRAGIGERADVPTGPAVVDIGLAVDASAVAAGLARGTGTVTVAGGCRWTRTLLPIGAVPATALAVRVAAQPIAVARGRTKGGTETTQTKDATKGRGGDGFEGLAA